jgi:acetolactate decarboxylase
MKNWLILFVSAFMFNSCFETPAVKVTRIGELEDLIKKGDMQTHAKLQDFANAQHLYALGSLTNLRGFTQVIDSRPYTAMLENGQLKIDSSFNPEETLLLYANVDDWKELDLSSDIKTWKQLEQFIGNEAIKYKVPKNYPSPFLLKGIVADAKWRVIDWDQSDKVVTYKKTVQSGLHGELQNEYITAIGFYSTESYEVLAHKETNMHIHFVNHDHSIAGHVDDLAFDGRMKLYLPKKYVEGK